MVDSGWKGWEIGKTLALGGFELNADAGQTSVLGFAGTEDAAKETLSLVALLALYLDAVEHDDFWAGAHDETTVGEAANVGVVWEIPAELGIEFAPGELVLGALTRLLRVGRDAAYAAAAATRIGIGGRDDWMGSVLVKSVERGAWSNIRG